MLTEEVREKIIQHAFELFMQYGVRSVTMDDVAREASMSKKTLYQYFENKADLVLEVAKYHLNVEAKLFKQIDKEAKDAIEELIMVTKCMRQIVTKMNPALLFDLQKYHANAWEKYNDFKKTVVQGNVKRNIERGKEEGVFREDIDPEIISTLRVELVQLAFNPKIFPREKFDFGTVQLQILDHFINGLLTDTGRKNYKEYIEKEESESYSMNLK